MSLWLWSVLASKNLSLRQGGSSLRDRRSKRRIETMADFKPITIDTVSIKVRMTKDTMELFSVPVPARQLEFSFQDPSRVRVLDNPLEDNLRNYVAWGKL
jgi:hypothetical protein